MVYHGPVKGKALIYRPVLSVQRFTCCRIVWATVAKPTRTSGWISGFMPGIHLEWRCEWYKGPGLMVDWVAYHNAGFNMPGRRLQQRWPMTEQSTFVMSYIQKLNDGMLFQCLSHPFRGGGCTAAHCKAGTVRERGSAAHCKTWPVTDRLTLEEVAMTGLGRPSTVIPGAPHPRRMKSVARWRMDPI